MTVILQAREQVTLGAHIALVGPSPDETGRLLRELLGLDDEMPSFFKDGVCAQTDPEAFFPERGQTATAAKKVCAGCPLAAKEECLEYALEHDEYGVWGGTTVTERGRIIQRRRAARKALGGQPAAA